MRYILSMTPGYRKSWDTPEFDGPYWPIIREVVQGALDAEVQHGAAYSIDYDPRKLTLKVSSKGVKLPRSMLLLGETTKAGDDRVIGEFGEGLKIAMLVAVRNDIPITIRNGADEVWIPRLETTEAWPDRKVLTVETRKQVRLSRTFDVEIGGVTPTVWAHAKRHILPLGMPEGVDVRGSRVITDPAYKGEVFVKGVYITKMEGLRYGYNFGACADIDIDIDRRLASECTVKFETGRMWHSLCNEEQLVGQLFELIEANSPDVEYLNVYEDKATANLVKAFVEKYGADAYPTAKADLAPRAELAGIKIVPCGFALTRILGKKLTLAEDHLAALAHAVSEVVPNEALSSETQAKLVLARELINELASAIEGDLPKLMVVEFLNGGTGFSFDAATKTVHLGRAWVEGAPTALRVLRKYLEMACYAMRIRNAPMFLSVDVVSALWEWLVVNHGERLYSAHSLFVDAQPAA